jgi:hypothetical protein
MPIAHSILTCFFCSHFGSHADFERACFKTSRQGSERERKKIQHKKFFLFQIYALEFFHIIEILPFESFMLAMNNKWRHIEIVTYSFIHSYDFRHLNCKIVPSTHTNTHTHTHDPYKSYVWLKISKGWIYLCLLACRCDFIIDPFKYLTIV